MISEPGISLAPSIVLLDGLTTTYIVTHKHFQTNVHSVITFRESITHDLSSSLRGPVMEK